MLSSRTSKSGPQVSWLHRSRLRNARLIACDLDGTLLNRDAMIGPQTTVLIKKVSEIGIPFILTTARHHQAVEPFSIDLRMEDPIISLDGAMTREPLKEDALSFRTFDREFALDIIAESQKTSETEYCIISPDCFYLSDIDLRLPSKHLHWNIETGRMPESSNEIGTILELIIVGNFGGVNALYGFVNQKMKKKELHLRMYESVTKGDCWYLEVRAANADKLTALNDLVASRGISMKQVIAIGDNRNDLDFCSSSGYVVAVDNAIGDLKAMAHFVTKRDCLDEGINEFLEAFLKIRGVDVGALLRPFESERSLAPLRVRSR